jgi:hypothetical protein
MKSLILTLDCEQCPIGAGENINAAPAPFGLRLHSLGYHLQTMKGSRDIEPTMEVSPFNSRVQDFKEYS